MITIGCAKILDDFLNNLQMLHPSSFNSIREKKKINDDENCKSDIIGYGYILRHDIINVQLLNATKHIFDEEK